MPLLCFCFYNFTSSLRIPSCLHLILFPSSENASRTFRQRSSSFFSMYTTVIIFSFPRWKSLTISYIGTVFNDRLCHSDRLHIFGYLGPSPLAAGVVFPLLSEGKGVEEGRDTPPRHPTPRRARHFLHANDPPRATSCRQSRVQKRCRRASSGAARLSRQCILRRSWLRCRGWRNVDN